MKKYEELHTTIHSLDSHEIRYFKLFASRHIIGESNTYLKLFDAIRKQKKSNDNELRGLFKKDAFIRNLPSAKLYLLRLINKSLYHYHDKEDPLSVILRHIKLAELFFIKEHYELADSNLKKAKKLAEQEEQFVFNLFISELQIKLSVFSANAHKIEGLINDEMAYEKEIFLKYLNLREYQHAYAKFKTLEKSVFIPVTQNEKKQYDTILDQDIFNYVSMAQSNKARGIFYELKNSYQDKTKDRLQKQEITDELLDFFIEYPQLVRKNAAAFINATDQYLQHLLTNKNYMGFETGLKKFKALQAPTPLLQAQIISRATSLQLHSAFINDNLNDIKPIFSETEKQLIKFDSSIEKPLLFQLQHEISSHYFLKKRFRESLKWNLKILNARTVKTNHIVQKKAGLLNLLIHFQLKNDHFLLSKFTSQKRKDRYSLTSESRLLHLLLIKISDKSGTKQSLIQFEKETLGFIKSKQMAHLVNDVLLAKLFSDPKKLLFLSR